MAQICDLAVKTKSNWAKGNKVYQKIFMAQICDLAVKIL